MEGTAQPSPGPVLIVAWDPACLLPVFGETALSRLVRLAVSEGRAVMVWLAASLGEALSRRPAGVEGVVVWRVLDFSDLTTAAASLPQNPDESLLLVPGHSVWDRRSFRAALQGSGTQGPYSGFQRRVSQVASTVARWRQNGVPLPPEAPSLPVLLGPGADPSLAEARLVAALAAATQGSDGLLARWVDRPLSRRISPRLAARRVPPNAITLTGTAIGLWGGLLLAQGGYWLPLLGSVWFLLAVVLDGVDGEVARLSLRETRFGHWLDIITDNLVHLAVFCGIALGLHREATDARHLFALGALLLGFGLSAMAAFLVMAEGQRIQMRLSPWAARTIAALNSRDFAYLVVLLAVAKRLDWFLWGAAVGSYLFAGALLWLYFSAGQESGQKP